MKSRWAHARILNAKRGPNVTEEAFRDQMKEMGWTLIKKGWPDFACWHSERKQFIAVEVKPTKLNKVELKPEQEWILKRLERCGVRCFIWTPEYGLKPFREYRRIGHNPAKAPKRRLRLIPRGCLI